MSRPLRWVVVLVGSAVVFFVCFKLAQADPFGWLPEKDSDAVAVAAGFAGAMTAAVGLAGGWWAGTAPLAPAAPPVPERSVRQVAEASGTSEIRQAGGADPAGPVDQEARARDNSRIRQTGGGEPGGNP
ncbi:hypothetical protein [Streptomyces sp. XY332]|uniref:Uncharacterized protein n=1 Tax=Streptomyces sp. R33 TaxID=3238629 RepID=A0AB39Y3Q9_9ACTN|nr:hypothetical protein [Streptomyces sp. XY332]